MEYYFIYESREPSVIGHYPQTKPSEDKRGHFDGYDSQVRMNADEFPDFEPKYGIDIHPKALATDIIDRASLSFGFVVSERLKSLLKEFELPNHRFYPIDVFGTDKVYYWFHYITNIWKYIDFESTEIEVVHKFKFNLEQTKKFNSFNEVMNFKKSLPRQNTIRFGSIRLKNNFPNYDLFEITGPQYFTIISDRLKQKLVEENITGIGIKQYEKIQINSSMEDSGILNENNVECRIGINTDGFYRSKEPKHYVDSHGGHKNETNTYYFFKFFENNKVGRFSSQDPNFNVNDFLNEKPDYVLKQKGNYEIADKTVKMTFGEGKFAVTRIFTIVYPNELLDENLMEYSFIENSSNNNQVV